MSDSSIHLVGSAHLDPIWLWRWQEGCGEVLQTFRSALDRLSEYPGFVFTCSSAAYYKWVEEIDPDTFAEIVERVKEGRWVPVNGWWVQPDCNIPSGESFARQALYSQLYYYEKFGKICRVGYNVDSFGHNGMLPQLLLNGGMNAYVMMRPSTRTENPDIPENAFWWESQDGSRVLTYHIPESYGASGKKDIDRQLGDIGKRVEDTGHGMMLFYGVGNHGGGPTRGDIEYLMSKMESDGFAPLEFSSPDEYFRSLFATPVDFGVWKDDLQHHASGCYSAASLVKQLNRRAENTLMSAEAWNTVASKTASDAPLTEKFAEAWREVCFNQFHDILCGCSIMEAYEDVKDTTGYAATIAAKAENNALLRITNGIDTWIDGVSDPVCTVVRQHSANHSFPHPLVVFNPLAWEVEVPVRSYHPSSRVIDSEGRDVTFQNVRSSRSNDTHKDTVFIAKLPPMGYATYWLWFWDSGNDAPESKSDVAAGEEPIFIENKYLRAEFDRRMGGIRSLISKEDGCDYAGDGPLAVPTVIDDHKTDTWAHNVFRFHDIKGEMELVSIELVESGPARAVVRTKHRFNSSVLTQDFILASGQKLLRVKCKAIWLEDFTMLKFPFALDGKDGVSTYEIPCGFIKRPTNGEEEPHQKWADLTVTCADGVRRGIAVVNDSKYSCDCPGNVLRPTMLRNVIFADHYSDRPAANFNFTDEGLQRFEYGIYPHTGEVEKTDIAREAAQFNIRPNPIPVGYHKGRGEAQRRSFLTVDSDNVIVTAFKFCEDGSGDAILRLYETKGIDTVKVMIKCDILDAAFWTDIGHNEIKTFRIKPDGKVMEVNFLEGIVF